MSIRASVSSTARTSTRRVACIGPTTSCTWAYGDAYNVVSNHDPSIGTSVLNADGSVQAYGPWRTQEHSQKTRGYMLTVPTWFTPYTNGSTFGVGAPITSSDLMSPWGAALAAAPLPSNSTPADVPGDSHVSMACQRLIYHDINNKQRRDTNYNYCDYNVSTTPRKVDISTPVAQSSR